MVAEYLAGKGVAFSKAAQKGKGEGEGKGEGNGEDKGKGCKTLLRLRFFFNSPLPQSINQSINESRRLSHCTSTIWSLKSKMR